FAAERYLRTSGLFGTTAACVEKLEQLADLGVREVACLIDFGIGHDAVMQSLARLHDARERLLRTVAPAARARPLPDDLRDATLFQCTPSLMAMLARLPSVPETVAGLRVV